MSYTKRSTTGGQGTTVELTKDTEVEIFQYRDIVVRDPAVDHLGHRGVGALPVDGFAHGVAEGLIADHDVPVLENLHSAVCAVRVVGAKPPKISSVEITTSPTNNGRNYVDPGAGRPRTPGP